MPYLDTNAFVLGSTRFKEQDKLVYLLTLDKGIIKAIAPGALKARNRFGSVFELFTEGDFTCYSREGRDLVTVSRGEIITSYFNIVSDPSNIFYFYLIAEIITRFVPFRNKDTRVYRLVKSILEGSELKLPPNYLLLYFLVWILRIEGMFFKPQLCYNCFTRITADAWLKDDYQGILCKNCKQDEKNLIKKMELNFLQWSEVNAPARLKEWINRIEAKGLIKIFLKKIEFHGEFSLKSSTYLKEFK